MKRKPLHKRRSGGNSALSAGCEKQSYLCCMSQISISLFPFYIPDCDTSLVDAVLQGLFLKDTPLPEGFMRTVGIEVLDEDQNPEERPLVLIPGFVDFARKLLTNHPNFGYVASISNEFYRQALLASAGDISAVQKGDNGVIYTKGEPYLALIAEEVAKFEAFARERSSSCQMTIECHCHDLTRYLLFQEPSL
jgi:hypothetical protein